jgi:DNA-binding transcriptional LysR family regulator
MAVDELEAANLIALHVLLSERHVTRAARRLGISQSSMSHRLARLRQTFHDPLFTRSSSGLLPTPRAQAIEVPLRDALRALDAAVAPSRPFEPKDSHAVVSIAMPDLLAPLMPRLVAGLTTEAPCVTVQLSPIVAGLTQALATGRPSLAITPTQLVDDSVMARPLGETRFGVVGRRRHPAFRRPLTVARWLAYPHVIQRLGNDQTNTVDAELSRRGLRRRVAVEAPSFLTGLFIVASSDLLMNAPLPLVADAAATLGLATREAPLRLPAVRFSLCWHARFHADSAHRWARDRIFEIARSAFDGDPRPARRLP